jgi:hypothetical protein
MYGCASLRKSISGTLSFERNLQISKGIQLSFKFRNFYPKERACVGMGEMSSFQTTSSTDSNYIRVQWQNAAARQNFFARVNRP